MLLMKNIIKKNKMKNKAIRLGEMIKWWTQSNRGTFNTDHYLRVVYAKSITQGQ